MSANCDIGLIGLAVMGENLVLTKEGRLLANEVTIRLL